MKSFVRWASVLCLSSCVLLAQETDQEPLSGQLQRLQEQQRQMREHFEGLMREQQAEIDELKRRLAITESGTAANTNAPADPFATSLPVIANDLSTPMRVQRGAAYMDISLVGTFAAGTSTADDIEGGTQLGGHDPSQRGFTVQGAEVNFAGAVDPYFRGDVNVLVLVDSDGETLVELEEAWLETVALPGNLQLRAGQILTDFGRINRQHPHQWAFLDTPLVNGRFLGPDGLRNPGARLAWLAPTPFFTQLSLGIQNSHGATAASFRGGDGHSHGDDEEGDELPFGFRHRENDRGVGGLDDLLFSPRLEASFDLTANQTIMAGFSGAFGPNDSGVGGDVMTRIFGADLYWKWKPARAHGGFPFVSWQAEAMLRQYELGAFDWDENGNGMGDSGELLDLDTGLPANVRRETITDYGFYSQLLYGFRKGWVAGLRFDFLDGERARYERMNLEWNGEAVERDLARAKRWRVAPNLTWYPSEFSKIRLQYNYDDRRGVGTDHSAWLQFELLLGAHAAHTF